MPAPIEADIKALLASRERAILSVVMKSWERWWRNPERLILFRRTQATLIHNYMMIESDTAFLGDRGIHLIPGQETTFFLVDDRLLFRFKKGDERGITCNIETQAAWAFVDPQESLIDLPDVERVDIAYVLNPLRTLIDRVYVVAREGERVAWHYSIYPSAATTTIRTLPTRPTPQVGSADNVVRLPVVKKEESDDK